MDSQVSQESISSRSSSPGGWVSDSDSVAVGELKLLYESLDDFDESLGAAIIDAKLHPSYVDEHHLEGLTLKDSETVVTASTDQASSETDNAAPPVKTHFYGCPLSPEVALELMPPGEGGLTWHATLIPDDFIVNGQPLKGLSHHDVDMEKKTIKPRRPTMPLTMTDFLSSLTRVDNRYIFHGMLNGWPSLTTLEVLQIEQRRHHNTLVPSPKEVLSGQWLWMRSWAHDQEGAKGEPLTIPDPTRVYRLTLRGAPWTGHSWSATSPGHVFWYEAQVPRLSYGTNMLKVLSEDTLCTHIHMVSHRYAVARESPKDRLTYHSLCLLEWDHGQYCTVVEAAYLNGIGGYKGRSNWYHDKNEPVTHLFQNLPPEMICPWRIQQAEIRCYDVEAKSLSEFQEYIQQYIGPTQRFLDPQVSFSHPARLTFRSRKHIAQYLINYISRDTTYAELKRNCQTFTADLCSFLAGKKNIVPFHPVSRMEYQNRTYLFLYDSNMYESKMEKKRRKSNRQSVVQNN
jgi:hypothetical protein